MGNVAQYKALGPLPAECRRAMPQTSAALKGPSVERAYEARAMGF